MDPKDIENLINQVKNTSTNPLSLKEINTIFLGNIAFYLAKLHGHFEEVDALVFGNQQPPKKGSTSTSGKTK